MKAGSGELVKSNVFVNGGVNIDMHNDIACETSKCLSRDIGRKHMNKVMYAFL